MEKEIKISISEKKYIYGILNGVAIGKKMVEEAKRTNNKKLDNFIYNIHVPIKIICAGKGILIKGGKKYYSSANRPKKFVVIKKASHCFDEEGVEEKLFQETYSWFKKYI